MIPLSIPHLDGNEWTYVKECLDTGWVSSAGAYVNRFEAMVAEYAGSPHGVACMNGTAALHLSLRLSGVQAGDYVIVPNLTFIASANAVAYTGAEPIFLDIHPGTWQLDLDLLEDFLSAHTFLNEKDELVTRRDGRVVRAIMPVHVLGNMCDMERLLFIAHRYQLTVIEDATEALGSYYKGQHAGTFGRFGAFSFNGNKIITTGGGGVIITADEALAQQAKHLTTQAKVSPDEYIHDEIGYNYRLVNVLAALGVAQMERLPAIRTFKQKMDAFYREGLSGVGDITFQEVLPDVDPNGWLFTFRTARMRELLPYLNEQGVQSRPFWMPMNQLPMFKRSLYIRQHDHSNAVYQTSISIPSSAGLTDEQLEVVVKTIKQFY
ncbi:MAG: LegC family aminotransferase [Lewinella sp.]|nr:LegC family aminotransferase [Lewinella sp.]